MEKINYNSNTNQDIKGKFVNREILCNVNTMVDELLKAYYLDTNLGFDLIECDNYEAYGYDPRTGEQITEEEKEERIKRVDDILTEYGEFFDHLNTTELKDETFEHIQEKLFDLEGYKDELECTEIEEYPEIFEWWAVTGWFAEKLKEKGQIVYEYGSVWIWGRCTTGQAILLDAVISYICEDLEILQGQKSDWSKQN